MELGQLLKQARLEAGLSQRQLCADVITRNMLSQIENGSAHPSMETLRYLAGKLGKSVGYFLNEEVASPNQALLAKAREAFSAGEWDDAWKLLSQYADDGILDAEAYLLQALSCLALAETAVADARLPYADALLQKAQESGAKTPYYTSDLERRRLLLLAQIAPEESENIVAKLEDDELFLRGQAAFLAGNLTSAAALLDAEADWKRQRWGVLRGDVHFAAGEFAQAAQCYLLAEDKCLDRLERCYEKLGDYQKAYYYACRQRSG